jgi:hypothetical protein
MAKIVDSADIIGKASRGLMKDYFTTSSVVGPDATHPDLLRPNISFDDLKDLFKDHTFNYLVTKIVNSCTLNGWKIVDKEDRSKRAQEKELKLNKLGYDMIERSLFLNVIVYRNAFVESEWNINKTNVKQLHMLETTEMNINVDEHGELRGFTQIHGSGSAIFNKLEGKRSKNNVVFFLPDECTHFFFNRLTTNEWGYEDTRTISHMIFYKNKVEEYINQLFEKNQFRDVWNIRNPTSIDQVKDFVENIRLGNKQPDKHFIVEGEVEHTLLRDTAVLEPLVHLLNKYEEAISRFLLVPPILGGDVGSSSRSSGEFEVRYDFSTTVRSYQKVVAQFMNKFILPKIGMAKYTMVYNSFDKIDHEKALNIAANLKGLGYKPEAIHFYLTEQGLDLPDDSLPEDTMSIEGNAQLNQKLQNMNAPSRKPSDGSLVGTQKVGEDSSTRTDQIEGKAKQFDSRKYW